MPKQTEVPINGKGALARLYWMFFGNVLLAFFLVLIYEKDLRLPSLADAACLLALASLLFVRYLDIRFLNGLTGDGEPATMVHWRRYALLASSVGLGAWLVVRVLAHFQV